LLKTDKPHIAIVGENGTGRDTLIKCAAKKILKEELGILFKYSFVKIERDNLVVGTKYRGQFEERIKAICNEVGKQKNIVAYVPNLENFEEVNHLLQLLKSGIKVITVFTPNKAEKYFSANDFYKFFNVVRINQPKKEITSRILYTHIPRFQNLYSVEIDDKIIEEAIEYSNFYLVDELQPLKTISLLEEASASIELNRLKNPEDALKESMNKFNKYQENLKELVEEKNQAVRDQNFDKAASYRDKERKIKEELSSLKNAITEIRHKNRIKINVEDLINGIHLLTGIDKTKIRKKEKLILKTKQTIRTEYTGLPQFEFLQAQSILHGDKVTIKNGLAFVLIPHTKEYDELFYQYIKPAMEVHGLNVLKADNIFKPGNILSQVWAQIRTAELIVADVSGQNSNVIFELGLCYGIQRCPILLTRNPEELPFNIRNLRYITYENTAAGAFKLKADLDTSVGEFLSAVRTDLY